MNSPAPDPQSPHRAGMMTRKGNKSKRPGEIVKGQSKRSKAEIEEERQQALQQKDKKEKEERKKELTLQENIKKLSKLEDSRIQSDSNAAKQVPRHRNQVEGKPTISAPKKASRPRTRSSTGGQAGKASLNAKSSERNQGSISDEHKDAPAVAEPSNNAGGKRKPRPRPAYKSTDPAENTTEDEVEIHTPAKRLKTITLQPDQTVTQQNILVKGCVDEVETDIDEDTPVQPMQGGDREQEWIHLGDNRVLHDESELEREESTATDLEYETYPKTPKPTSSKEASVRLVRKDRGEHKIDPDFIQQESDDADDDYEPTHPEVPTPVASEQTPAKPLRKGKGKRLVREEVKANRVVEVGKVVEKGDKAAATEPTTKLSTTSKVKKDSSGFVREWIKDQPAQLSKPPVSHAKASKATTITSSTCHNTSTHPVSTSAPSLVQISTTKASKRKRTKPEPKEFNDVVKLGGLQDEDESEERFFALSSPPKGKVRLDNNHLVVVADAVPAPKAKSKTRAKKDDGEGTGSRKYKNEDLPAGTTSGARNRWLRDFMPLLIKYIASSEDVWCVKEEPIIKVMQTLWDYIYGQGIPHKITSGDAVYAIAFQRLSEWRAGFGSDALLTVRNMFEHKESLTDEQRREMARNLLENNNFLYEEVKTKGNGMVKRYGVFLGGLILQTFACYFNTVQTTTPSPPELGDLSQPKGALALATAAVNRALGLWRDDHINRKSLPADPKKGSGIIRALNPETGLTSVKQFDFNQYNWASSTQLSLNSMKNLGFNKDLSRMKKIVSSAEALIPRTSKGSGTTLSSNLTLVEHECPGLYTEDNRDDSSGDEGEDNDDMEVDGMDGMDGMDIDEVVEEVEVAEDR